MKKTSKKTFATIQKRQPGRPKSEESRRSVLPVRLSRSELDQVRADAATAGTSLAAYVRSRLQLPTTGYGDG